MTGGKSSTILVVMHIKKVSKTIPRPSRDAALELLDYLVEQGGEIHDPDVLVELIVIAYQNGRYDEASSETQAMAFE